MSELSADVGVLTAFGAAAGGHGRELAAAGFAVAAVGPKLLEPMFGAVGADFVAAFAAVHAGHVDAISSLAAIYHGMSAAATANAAGYARTDRSTAGGLDGLR